MRSLQQKIKTVADLFQLQERLKAEQPVDKRYIAVCGDTGCSVWGSKSIKDVFQECLEYKGLEGQVDIKFTGCLGLCESGPVVIICPEQVFYQKVKEEDVQEIVEKTVQQGEVIERLLYQDTASGQKYVYMDEIPFYEKQQRILMGDNLKIDPTSIYDYLALGGYRALARALTKMTPLDIIEEVKQSKLRGRGGAGFSAGNKWKECYDMNADTKYMICNADEGDPGAFMDRSLLEGNPHSVLEGLMIGGYAVGANEGIIYVRAEYPTAVEKIKQALGQAEELGLLGANILGSGFDFQISVTIGAGAFVSGETSAMIASIEGRVGEPRQKPPRLAQRGLWRRPTVVNNVESLANVPYIIREGTRYRQTGTEKSKGTKIFSLVGKVVNTGLVEVPLGLTLREIIFEIGGGIKDGKNFKAVQTGGPSGGCLPEYLLDTPTDFEELNDVGSMMGSGGMIVMDEETCMVDVARYFLRFLRDESCGKCFSCREGIIRMLEIVDDITEGTGTPGHIELLRELAGVVKDSTLCGLGQTSANPVLSTLRYFEDEYWSHIKDKKCPGRVCKALIRFTIDQQNCTGCGVCLKNCPEEAISGEKKEAHVINPELCSRCGICLDKCKFDAIIKS